MAALTDRGVPFSTLCPKYLHTNSTSHTQPFSAIAELIDNAYDPDVNAKQFWIDKTVVNGQDCLSFMDNGNGMDYETMHKMLSFGYSEKVAKYGKAPIGMYGNGFKSGSMRLGKDAIVFSKSKSVRCVGMLSQTYLEEIKAQQIIVPIVCYEQAGREKFSLSEEHRASLQEILSYSPFKTQKELLDEIDVITSSGRNTGTRIIIWNLRCDSSGKTEFDFDFDRYDIRMPSDVYQVTNDKSQHQVIKSYIPDCVYSLRAYCRILYLKPRMQIIVRGENVKSELIAKSLAFSTKDQYKPLFLPKAVPITFGYNTKSKDQCGVMMYHKNRLIKAYERVGCQLRAQNKGIGVIAIIECNFLDPTHNKQDFIESDKYRKTINSLGVKLEEYWEEIRHRRNKEDPNSVPVEDAIKKPDQNWVQCDTCLKWRKLPDGIDNNKLPDKWYCRLNPDPQFRSCQVEEEPEDSGDEQPYRKTYKQQQREDKKLKEKTKQMEEKDPKRIEEQLLGEINLANKALNRQYNSLRRQLFEKSAPSPATPTTTESPYKNKSPSGGTPGAISSPACSPASNDALLPISKVYPPTPGLQGQKRPLLAETPRSNKKSKVMGLNQDSPDAPASVDVCHDTFEKASTPKSRMPNSNVNKLKAELEESKMECSNNAVTNMGLEKSVATQTKLMVKNENVSQSIGVPAEPIVRPHSANVPEVFFAMEPPQQVVTRSPASGVLEQRERLREQMEEAIKERDTLRERVHMLTHQLQEAKQKADKQVDSLLLEMDECKKERDEVRSQVDGLLSQLGECKKEKDEVRSQVDGLLSQLDECKKEKDEACSQVNGLLLQMDECKKERDEVRSKVNGLLLQLDECKKEKNEERLQVDSLLLHLNECKKEKDEVHSQVDRLLLQLDECKKERDEARSKADGLLLQLDQWKRKNDEVRSQCAEFMLKLQRGENAP